MISKTIEEINDMLNGELILNGGNLKDRVEGICIDSRKLMEHNLYIPLLGERVDGHNFISDIANKGASLTLCSNKDIIPLDIPVIFVEDTLIALQKLARKYRESLDCKVIGITGSNGKTSCKDILAGCLSSVYKTQKTQGNHNNEIGVPLTLLELDEDVEMAVIEMGMENREEIHFLNEIVQQDIALITNVGIAHLENLGSLENIAKAKLEIVDSLKTNDLFIYYGDDLNLSKVMKDKSIPMGVNIKTFGNNDSNTIYLTSLKQDELGIYFKTNRSGYEFHLNILGEHQALNALGAILIAYSLGMKDEDIQNGFHIMEKTGMRNELMKIKKSIILNDAYKSNPQSAYAALDTFYAFKHPYRIAVLADMLELGDTTQNLHYDLGYHLDKYHLSEILCLGELATFIAKGAKETCSTAKILTFADREILFDYLKDYIDKDCMILFKGSRGMGLDLVIDKMKEYGE